MLPQQPDNKNYDFKYSNNSKARHNINDGECFVCKQQINSFSGNPSEWGFYFPHIDGVGEDRYYHVKCLYPILIKVGRRS